MELFPAIIGLVGAIIGSVITIVASVLIEKRKESERYENLLRSLLNELRANLKRMEDTYKYLPIPLQKKFEENKFQGIKLEESDFNLLSWSFPKPYSNDAWKSLILSGLIVNLPQDASEVLYLIYEEINSINFLGELSVEIFKILSRDNNLDPVTNQNFDKFCKSATLSLQIVNINKTKKGISKLLLNL